MNREDFPLSVSVDEGDEYAVITPSGYLNALTGDHIDKVCEQLVDRQFKYFIINFSRVELINTIGISILVGIIEKVRTQQGRVYFAELDATNRDIFEVLSLSTVALICPTNDAALEHLRRDRETLRRAMGE